MKLSVLVLCSFLITSGLTKDASKKIDDKTSSKREIPPPKAYLPPSTQGGAAYGGRGLGPYGGHGSSFSSHGGGSFGSPFVSAHGASFGGGNSGSFGGRHGGSFVAPQSSGFGGSYGGFGGPKGGQGGSFGGQGPTVETYIITSGFPSGQGLSGNRGFSSGRHLSIGGGLGQGGGYGGGYGGGKVTLKTIAVPATFTAPSGMGHGGSFNGGSFGELGGGKFESYDIGGYGGQGFANFGSNLGHGIGLVAVGHGDAGLAGLEGAGLFSGGYRYGAPSPFGSSGHASFGPQSFGSSGHASFSPQSFGGGHSTVRVVATPSGSYGVPLAPPLSSYAPAISEQAAAYESGAASLDLSGNHGNSQASGASGISAGYEAPAYAAGHKSLRHFGSSDSRYNVIESKPLAVTPATILHTSFSSSSRPTSGSSSILSTAGPSKAPFRPSIFLGATHETNDGSTGGHYTSPAHEFNSASTGYAAPTSDYGAQSLGAAEHSFGNIEQSFAPQQHNYGVPQASYVVAEQHQAYIAPAGRQGSPLTAVGGYSAATGFDGNHHHHHHGSAAGPASFASYLQQVTKPGNNYLPPSGSHH